MQTNLTHCIFCNGTGKIFDKEIVTCNICMGAGKVTSLQLENAIKEDTRLKNKKLKEDKGDLQDVPYSDTVNLSLSSLLSSQKVFNSKNNTQLLKTTLIECIIPLEVLYTTELNNNLLCDELKTSIKTVVEKVRTLLKDNKI